MSTARLVTRGIRAQLGEAPHWSASENALYWVDMMGQCAYRLTLPDEGLRRYALPQSIAWLVEREGPGFLAGMAQGVARLDLDPLRIELIGHPEPDISDHRLNDAKVDARGRLWLGTMQIDAARASGALYRLDPDLSWHRMDGGYRVTNGPAFSPDGTWLYHADSLERVIYRFAVHSDGSLGVRESFVRFEVGEGMPDGMTVDAEGGLWVAHWDGARVTRFSPDGRALRCVEMPVSRPTSVAFAGIGLDRLFVTSAACELDEPLAGELFEIEPGVRGLAPQRFRA